MFDRDLGGYRLDTPQDATELPGFWFTQDEILALMTIQSMIEQLDPGLLGPKLKPLRKRLDDMLTHQGLDPQQLTQRVRALIEGRWHVMRDGMCLDVDMLDLPAGNEVVSLVADPRAPALAARTGNTRSAAGPETANSSSRRSPGANCTRTPG